MDDLRKEAHAAGAVLDQELVDRAVVLDQRIAELSARVDTQLKTAFVNAGTAAFGIVDAINDASAALDELITKAGNSSIFANLNKWLAARGLIDPSGVTFLDQELNAAVGGNMIREMRNQHVRAGAELLEQREHVKRIEEQPSGANKEVQSGIDLHRTATSELERQRDVLREMEHQYHNIGRAIREAEQSGGTFNPATLGQFGPAVPNNISGSEARKTIIERAAHGNVTASSMKDAAAAGAAAALKMFPGLKVSSAHRSAAYNASIGGAKRSRHIEGDAIDFVGVDASNVAAVVEYLKNQGFRGFGYYNNGSLHADMGAPRAWGPDRTRQWTHLALSQMRIAASLSAARKLSGRRS